MRFMILVLMLFLCCGSADGAIVGYWRLNTDSDVSANGLNSPNEVIGSPLISASASISPVVFGATIPQTGEANTGSLNGNASINGSIAAYAALDSSSITVEFWARTQESGGTLISRTTGQTFATLPTTLVDGLAIDTFNAVRVRYAVSDGAGGATIRSIVPATAVNLDSPWVHLAFTYDSASGIGSLYANGVAVGSDVGIAGRSLVWNAATPMYVGGDMDGGNVSASNTNGIFDELRISDEALAPSQFLNATAVPEPSTMVLTAIGMLALLACRTRVVARR